ncbi:RNA polymerase sigma factor [Chondrinema litorale]|uniref:RNA polymerase sigma factor n=1 Tax=Chondrinema litorale TaxID=2994555 RepID=UPI00254365C3|nr:sigma-70 family RNA polymerase sigma factor [Chondrinema litorale]UZR99069.1 sigma-70 family RNA polymerase sigma factor [Chondrinema litorale]
MSNLTKDFDFTTLWKRLKAGDRNAFNTTIGFFYKLLFSYGFKISGNAQLTEDCIQDLFIYIWENKNKLGDVKDVKAYLLKSLRRRILEALSRWDNRKQQFAIFQQEFDIVFSHEDLLIQDQFNKEKVEKLTSALNNLPPRQREALYLKFYGEASYQEIGEIMGINNQSVGNLLQRAIKLLKDYILLFILLIF